MAVKKHLLSSALGLMALASTINTVAAFPGAEPFPELGTTSAGPVNSVIISRSITWPSTPATENPTPAPTPTDLLKPVILGCHGAFEPRTALLDPTRITKEHTCIRDTLAALANYHEFCDDKKKDQKCGSVYHLPPSLDSCCGIWTDRDIPEKYKNSPIVDLTSGDAKVLSLDTNDFQSDDVMCARYRPETQEQYRYYMQNLEKYGLHDLEPTNMMSFALPLDEELDTTS